MSRSLEGEKTLWALQGPTISFTVLHIDNFISSTYPSQTLNSYNHIIRTRKWNLLAHELRAAPPGWDAKAQYGEAGD